MIGHTPAATGRNSLGQPAVLLMQCLHQIQHGVDAGADRERFGSRPGCVVTDDGLVVIGKGERLPLD